MDMGTLSGKASCFVWACLCFSYHLEGEMRSFVLYSVTFAERFLSTCIFSSLLPNRLAETLVYTVICNQYTSIYSSRSEARSTEQSEFIISSREARAQCVNRAWVLGRCKVADFIFICIYAMVSTMTSYGS